MIMLKKIEAAVSFSLKIGSHYLVFCLWLHRILEQKQTHGYVTFIFLSSLLRNIFHQLNLFVYFFSLVLFFVFYQRPTVHNNDRATDLAKPPVSPPIQLVICLLSAVPGTGVSFSVVFLSGVAPILCSPSHFDEMGWRK
jgi:phosphoribulokinase